MATKTKKVKVKLAESAKAKDSALAEALKQDRAAARKARKEQDLPETSNRKYSKDVAAAIAQQEDLKVNPIIYKKFTPIVEKELDIAISEQSLESYKNDPSKGGLYNAYFIKLYEGFLITLNKELNELKKKS